MNAIENGHQNYDQERRGRASARLPRESSVKAARHRGEGVLPNRTIFLVVHEEHRDKMLAARDAFEIKTATTFIS